nr:6576_t:CDS:2 [Entrophospora candida]
MTTSHTLANTNQQNKKFDLISCGFFLAGEADGTRRYIAETMLEELNIMAEEEGQFDKSKVPKLQTICGWITSYAAVF